MAETLKPCPFCGNKKPYFERMGTSRQSCIVECGNCGCQHESSDEGADSGRQWNERTEQQTGVAEASATGAEPIHDKRCPAALNLSDPCNCGETS